jgi:dihydroflavonol-4-reductase
MFIVTGATGHIGNTVVKHLLAHHLEVKVLIRKMDEALKDLPIDIHIGDVFDDVFLDAHISSDDIVIHSAGYIDLLNKDRLLSFRTNYWGTKKIVDICIEKKARLVYISSVDAITKSKKGFVSEPNKMNPKMMKSNYAISKALATEYVLDHMSNDLDAIILYPSAVIGTNDFKPSAAGKEILSVLKNRYVFALRGGYNFIDVRDVAEAIYQAAISKKRDHIILSGYDKTIKELYHSIERASNTHKIIIPLPTWLVRLAVIFTPKYSQMMISTIQENYHYDNEKMRKYLLPNLIPFEKTMADTVFWLTNHHFK